MLVTSTRTQMWSLPMINELKNGFLAALRLLMCLPLAISWMLLYGLIALSYGIVRTGQFILMWNAFVYNDTPVKKESCGCG